MNEFFMSPEILKQMEVLKAEVAAGNISGCDAEVYNIMFNAVLTAVANPGKLGGMVNRLEKLEQLKKEAAKASEVTKRDDKLKEVTQSTRKISF